MRRSCDACACAKRKCDGESRCSLCTKKGIPCVYSERQKSGPKGNHTPGAKQAAAAAVAAADGALASKGRKTDKKRPSHATGGPTPKKKVAGGVAPAAAATAVTATATAAKRQQVNGLSPSPLTLKPETPRPSPPLAPITAAPPKSSPASSPAGSSPTSKLTMSPVPAAARPRQQPRTVAKKEPRPRHQLKNHDGGKGKDPAAAPAVVTPVGCPSAASNNGDGARMPVTPPLPSRLSLSSSKAPAAAAVVASSSKDANPPLSSMLLRDDVLPSAVSASGSSIDGASSSLSWDDVPDVFVSSLEDDVLWSCDDFSDDGTGGDGSVSGVGAEGHENHFQARGFVAGLTRGKKVRAVESTVSPTMEMMLLDDPPASTTSRYAGGFGDPHQLRRQESPSMLLKSPPSPAIVSPQQMALSEGSRRYQQPVEGEEPIVVGVLPAESRRSSTCSASSASSAGTDIGRRQNSLGSVSGDVTSSPISSWPQDAVEAGASTLLAVLADTDFCGAAVGRDMDGVTGAGGGHGGLLKQQQLQPRFNLNQYRHNTHHQHHRLHADIRSSGTATIGNYSARASLRWPPQGTALSLGRAVHFGLGSRTSPPASTPSATATAAFAAVGSRPWHQQAPFPGATMQQRYDGHHQQRRQPHGGPVSLDGRTLAEGMSTASKGGGVDRGERSGSKTFQTASL
eukprot:g5378.t1